jgi:hypothetical protein
MSLGAGCKGGHLLMSHVYPLNDFTLTDCLGQPIQGIASHTIDSPYSRMHECFDKDFSYFLRHCVSSPPLTVLIVVEAVINPSKSHN